MLGTLSRFKFTTAAALVGLFIWSFTFFTNAEIFELIIVLLKRLESYQGDEIAVSLILVLLGVTIDSLLLKRERKQQLEIFQQRLRVLRATMRTVQDIVLNFLNQVQLFRVQAENCKDFPAESLRALDAMIHKTSSRLNVLSDMEGTPEKEISAGLTVIDVSAAPSKKRPISHRDAQ